MPFSYKGAITFGLVYIPVTLTPAIRENDIGFNMLEKKTLSRVKYKKTCVDCDGRELASGDIVKGYQYEKGQYVVFTDEDFEKVRSAKDSNITISAFTDMHEVDPIYFARAFYVAPTGGERAYALLLRAMEKEGRAAIAKTVLGTREALVVLRVRDGRMLANTLYYHDEVQTAPYIQVTEAAKLDKTELDLAVNLINNLGTKFKPSDYHDEYNARLRAAIEQKIAGLEVEKPQETKSAKIINIMDALKRSIELTGGKTKRTGSQR